VKHYLSVEIATKFGVEIAVIMDLFINCNYKNKENPQETTWIEFDEQALCEYFIYFPPKKIKSLLKKCVSLNLLIKHPNKSFCFSLNDLKIGSEK